MPEHWPDCPHFSTVADTASRYFVTGSKMNLGSSPIGYMRQSVVSVNNCYMHDAFSHYHDLTTVFSDRGHASTRGRGGGLSFG